MLKAAAILLLATLAVAPMPIQKPLESLPAQSVARTDSGGAAPPAIPSQHQPQPDRGDEHRQQDPRTTDYWPRWVEVAKAISEAVSIAVTAIFTVFLALWTRGLRKETKNLVTRALVQEAKMTESVEAMRAVADQTAQVAGVGNRQIESLMRAERPHLVVEVIDSGVEVGADGLMRFANHRMKIQFANYGRTPALLNELVELYPVIEGNLDGPVALDPMIDRGRMLPDGTISAFGKPYEILTNLMNESDAMRLRQPNAWKTCRLFFHGYIRFSDTFGKNYVKGFSLVFRPTHNRWIARGGEDWNFTRIETDVPPAQS